VFDGDGDIARHAAQMWRQAVHRFADQFLEPLRRDLFYAAVV
jgi:hypothetical protein